MPINIILLIFFLGQKEKEIKGLKEKLTSSSQGKILPNPLLCIMSFCYRRNRDVMIIPVSKSQLVTSAIVS
jgi:hypothetical protein